MSQNTYELEALLRLENRTPIYQLLSAVAYQVAALLWTMAWSFETISPVQDQ